MHPRISVSALSSVQWTLDQDLAYWDDAGITNVGVWLEKLEAGDLQANVKKVASAGLRVCNLVAMGFTLDRPDMRAADEDRILGALDAAAAMGAECVMITPGRAGGLTWEEAAGTLAEAIVPVRTRAAELGIPLGFEHMNPLRSDVGFIHTLHDAVDLARRLDVKVLMEINNCWAERGLADTIAASAGTVIGLVQLDDYRIGTATASHRVVPGDGDIPIARIIGQLEAAGYAGTYDLEILGPAIEEEGYRAAIARSLEHLERIFESLPTAPTSA
jgi:sugar phosphate isomerase/epimerase